MRSSSEDAPDFMPRRPEEEPEGSLPESFDHVFRPPADGRDPRTLLLLHGMGGDETSLLPLARRLAPTAAVLGVRGKVDEAGRTRFFRRFADGALDVDDLLRRAKGLAAFVRAFLAEHGRPADRLVAVGYSNGANMAQGLLLLEERLLAGAVLLRPMMAVRLRERRSLERVPVLISSGHGDPYVSEDDPVALKAYYESLLAEVTLWWQPTGHELNAEERTALARWFQETFPPDPSVGASSRS